MNIKAKTYSYRATPKEVVFIEKEIERVKKHSGIDIAASAIIRVAVERMITDRMKGNLNDNPMLSNPLIQYKQKP